MMLPTIVFFFLFSFFDNLERKAVGVGLVCAWWRRRAPPAADTICVAQQVLCCAAAAAGLCACANKNGDMGYCIIIAKSVTILQ